MCDICEAADELANGPGDEKVIQVFVTGWTEEEIAYLLRDVESKMARARNRAKLAAEKARLDAIQDQQAQAVQGHPPGTGHGHPVNGTTPDAAQVQSGRESEPIKGLGQHIRESIERSMTAEFPGGIPPGIIENERKANIAEAHTRGYNEGYYAGRRDGITSAKIAAERAISKIEG